MSDGSRDATFAASFGLREILSASGFDTTGAVPDVVVDDPLLVLVVSVAPEVVSLVADVVEYLEAFASALMLFASVFAIFVSALPLLAVVFDPFTSIFVAGFVDVVVGAPVFAGLIELPPFALELPCPEVDFMTGALVGFEGLTPFGPAMSLA